MDAFLESATEELVQLKDRLNELLGVISPHRLRAHGELPSVVATSLSELPAIVERITQRVSALEAANQELRKELAERTHTEAALRERERESRLVLDTIPAGAAIMTADGGVAFVNNRMIEYFGKTFEELTQWGTSDAVHPDDLPHVIAAFRHSLTTGDPYDTEERLRRFDGSYRWFQVRGLPVRDDSGGVARWYVLHTDIDDRKRAEDALRESERGSRLIVDSIPGLVAILRPSGELAAVNERVVEYCGRSREELQDWATNDTLYGEDRDRVVQRFADLITSGRPSDWEARIRRADGVYRWFQFRALPLCDSVGQVVRWYALLTDIDDLKRAEGALRRSEAFLAQAQRLTLTGSLWWKLPTGEITWSDESYRVMGYSKTVTPTVALILNRVHPEDLSLVRETVDRSAREGADMDFEHRLLMPDGSIKWVHVVLQNVAAESGPPEFIGAVSDITERKSAEAELRRAYDHLTEAQRLSQTGSFTGDFEKDEHFVSEEFYRICEFEPGSKVTLQRLAATVHPEDVTQYEDAISRALAGTESDFHFRIVTGRGVVKHLQGFAHRISDRPVFVGAVQDVTASKMAQEALNKASAELAHVSRMTTLSALTASVAHEVNQPLSGIITNAGTCLRMLDAVPPDVDGARETARRTIRDGNRASDVITRVRALFSKKEFALEPLDLNEAVREVIALSANDLQRDRVILHSEFGDDMPLVAGDRIQLQQVILNLLRNAADAMVDVHDRPRQLLIRTEHDDRAGVRVSVRDVGVGLPQQSASAVFDAFFTTKSGGMGIGLFVSRSIIERHQGRLWAESNDGGPGATFSFSIPGHRDDGHTGPPQATV